MGGLVLVYLLQVCIPVCLLCCLVLLSLGVFLGCPCGELFVEGGGLASKCLRSSVRASREVVQGLESSRSKKTIFKPAMLSNKFTNWPVVVVFTSDLKHLAHMGERKC